MKARFGAENTDCQPMVEAAYSTAGDKYRLTLINVSGVEKWFKPSESPVPRKKKSILLVPCAKHVKVRDIDTEKGVFKHDEEYKNSLGETVSFKQYSILLRQDLHAGHLLAEPGANPLCLRANPHYAMAI